MSEILLQGHSVKKIYIWRKKMAKKDQKQTTTRAYTMRLKGMDPEDSSWRDMLWESHVAINRGARAFGDWLLTFRGGICHTLADTPVPVKGKPDREPTREEKKDKRILLALSWLSVESEAGAPQKYLVSHEGKGKRRRWQTVEALEDILHTRGLPPEAIRSWLADCAPAVSSAIRDDAVWVNRSKAFDDAVKMIGDSLTRDEIWDLLDRFFNSKTQYITPIEKLSDKDDDAPTEKIESKDLVQKALGWISNRFGKAKGADFESMAYAFDVIADWAKSENAGIDTKEGLSNLIAKLKDKGLVVSQDNPAGIMNLVSRPGPPNKMLLTIKSISKKTCIDDETLNILKGASTDAEECRKKIGRKGPKPWSDGILADIESQCGFTYRKPGGTAANAEFSVMLDHAARRVSGNQSWIRLAEANRRSFDNEADKISLVLDDAKTWLDAYCERRAGTSGAIDAYVINKRAIEGWGHVVQAWSQPDCKTVEDRIKAARNLQSDQDIEKFGDIQLFEALADDDAVCVWLKDGKPSPDNLKNYVAAAIAVRNKLRFKVPAYRHPDPLLHPVFIDYGNSRLFIKFAAHKPKKGQDIRSLVMTIIRNGAPETVSLLWQSKKLMADFDLRNKLLESKNESSEPANVSRADRLGLAASAADPDGEIHIMNVFDEKHWNGRLQAPRAQLEALDRALRKNGGQWDERTLRMKNSIQWFVTFSPKLQPAGPWIDFAKHNGLNPNSKYYPPATLNKGRKGMARILLSRLPGLRILSVDLGHRIAASCAVWETLSSEQMQAACSAAGHDAPGSDDIFIHLSSQNPEGQTRNVIYRRIGADLLPDGSPHPAPWARLDRQFPVKLQGEAEKPRKPGPLEYEAVAALEQKIGLVETEPIEKRFHHVDKLMSHAVRIGRLGLRRHTTAARIAFNLTTDKKALPGGSAEKLSDDDRVKLLTDSLFEWHLSASSTRWKSPVASALWKEHIQPLTSGIELPDPDSQDTEMSAPARKKKNDTLKATLKPAAEKLAGDRALCIKLHKLWADLWAREDSDWKVSLRTLRDWLLPSGKSTASGAIRCVGGLSVERITTLKSLYQLQKAFFTRLTPEGRQVDESSGQPLTAGEHFGKRTLDAIEKLRENRVKQTASRITEAALGIGIESKRPIEKDSKRFKGKMPARPSRQVFKPCHAVIVENLRHYRPEEVRTRRENRQLMSWASSKIFDHLANACELNGLLLREVSAAYTSRQDSRTGAPGSRCKDVPVKDFIGGKSFWKNEIARSDKKFKKGTADSRDDLLLDLRNFWEDKPPEVIEKARPIRIIYRGGELFVSADALSPLSNGIQADINAAANIGLKALLDPDWAGAWWYVPCNTKTHKPLARRAGGSTAIDTSQSLKEDDTSEKSGKKKNTKKTRDVVNLWRDPSGGPVHDSQWSPTTEYWQDVQKRVVSVLRKYNKLE